MRKILAISNKELKILLRNPGGLILLFIMPSMFLLVLSVALQGAFSSESGSADERIEVLLVDEESTGSIGQVIEEGLEQSDHFTVIREIDGERVTRKRARHELETGKHEIAIVIPEGAMAAMRLERDEAVEVMVDPVISNQITVGVVHAVESFVLLAVIEDLEDTISEIRDELEDLSQTTCELDQTVAELDDTVGELEGNLDVLEGRMDEMLQVVRKNIEFTSAIPGTGPMLKGAKAKLKKAEQGLESQRKERLEANGGKVDERQDEPRPDDCVDGQFVGKIERKEGIRDAYEKGRGLHVQRSFVSTGEAEPVSPNSVQQNVPGWTIFALFWIAQILALNILAERSSGAWTRIRVSPVGVATYLVGKMLPYVIVNLMQALLMFSMGIWILPLLGCPPLEIVNVDALIALTLSISFAAIGFGLLLASLSDSSFFVASLSATILIILAVLGGIMVPRIVMPAVMQDIGLFVPHGWALDGYLDVLVRGHTLIQILPDVGVIMGFALVFFLVAMARMKWSKRDSV